MADVFSVIDRSVYSGGQKKLYVRRYSGSVKVLRFFFTMVYGKMSSVIRKIISTAAAPKPVGPYNQAVVLDTTVYVSGVLGLNKDTMKLVEGGTAAEARQALKSLGCILEAAGSSFDKVVKTHIFLNDINDFAAVNEIYKEFFKSDFPARSTFQVGKLPLGANIEIEVVAGVGDVKTVQASNL